MRNLATLHWVLLSMLVLQACGAVSPTAEAIEPTLSNDLFLTPAESTLVPETSTALPTEETMDSHAVTFSTPDGATLHGELYGFGEVAVIFSVMGNCDPGWQDFAQLTATQGFVTLTYLWRGCRASGSANEDEMKKFVDDLRGAVAFMHEQGAKKIILVGASLGGCASAKLAAEAQADGLVVVASPIGIPQWDFSIESGDLDTAIPKLFISAEADDTVPVDASHELFNLAADPKEWKTYPGTAHGTELFDTENKDEFQQQILEFLVAIKDSN